MGLPINGGRRASEELSEALKTILADADDEELMTLGMACDKLKETLAEQGREASHEGNSGQSIYGELQALVEEYGEGVPAREFITMKASDNLSEVIEELLNDTDEKGVTIGLVRDAVKEAMIDPDAEHALIAELDALIERYGEDALAQDVLLFE